MLRFLFLFLAVLGIVALITRSPRVTRALWLTFALIALYAVLKLTGVIDAIAPARLTVF